MYNPSRFEETRREVLEELMKRHPLAALVTSGLEVTHLPLVYSDGVLRGHMARANPQWKQYAAGTEALAIFQGPQHYVSPSWYPSKAEHGKVVPTWNYVVVHARGPLEIIEDAEWLLGNVTALTESQEEGRGAPWRVSDAPEEYVENLLRAIVGVEMRITSLEGKWKVSQNRPVADRRGVVEGLSREERGGDMAREVRERLEE